MQNERQHLTIYVSLQNCNNPSQGSNFVHLRSFQITTRCSRWAINCWWLSVEIPVTVCSLQSTSPRTFNSTKWETVTNFVCQPSTFCFICTKWVLVCPLVHNLFHPDSSAPTMHCSTLLCMISVVIVVELPWQSAEGGDRAKRYGTYFLTRILVLFRLRIVTFRGSQLYPKESRRLPSQLRKCILFLLSLCLPLAF